MWQTLRDEAQFLLDDGRLNEAFAACDKALDQCSDDGSTAQCLLLRAQIHLKHGTYAAALLDARRSARLLPTCAPAFLVVAKALDGLGRGDAAQIWYRKFSSLQAQQPCSVPPGLGHIPASQENINTLETQIQCLSSQLDSQVAANKTLMQQLSRSEELRSALESRMREMEQENQRMSQEFHTIQMKLQEQRQNSESGPCCASGPEVGETAAPMVGIDVASNKSQKLLSPSTSSDSDKAPSSDPLPAPMPKPPVTTKTRGASGASQVFHPESVHHGPQAKVASMPETSAAPPSTHSVAEAVELLAKIADPSIADSADATCQVISSVPSTALSDKVKTCFIAAVRAEGVSIRQALQLYMAAWLALQEWLTCHEDIAESLSPLVEALLQRISVLKSLGTTLPAVKHPTDTKPASQAPAVVGDEPKSQQTSAPTSKGSTSSTAQKGNTKLHISSTKASQMERAMKGVESTLHAPTVISDSQPATLKVCMADMIDCSPCPKAGIQKGNPADLIAASLKERGYAVCESFCTGQQVASIRTKVQLLQAQEGLYERSEIWVGKNSDVGAQLQVPEIRGDAVCWMSQEMIKCWRFTALEDLVSEVDGLVLGALKGHRLLPQLSGLYARSDPMLAVYPGGGARFQKHIDNSAQDGRKLTVVCYLNPNWNAEDGGALRLHPSDTQKVDVLPLAGHAVLFFSEQMAHEVLPSKADRHAVTVWYYDQQEHERAKAAAKKVNLPDLPEEARIEARDFIKDTLADTVEAHSLEEMRARARKLSFSAAQVIAGVVGAATPQEFLSAMDRLTPVSLHSLRESFRNMGL